MQRGNNRLGAFLRHGFVEAFETLVVQAPAGLELLDNACLHAAQHTDPLRSHREVLWSHSPSQPTSVLGGQSVRLVGRLVFHHPARHHGPEPFTDVTVVEAGCFGDLLRRRPVHAVHRVEQTRTVADREHHHQGRRVERSDEAVGKRLGLRLVPLLDVGRCLRRCHAHLLLR